MNPEILNSRQLIFLEEFGRDTFLKENFYLTGGTALAAFYLGHRYSEDLDFFSEKEFDNLGIDIFLKKIQSRVGYAKVDFQKSLNRNLFFLIFGDGKVLKTEFTFFPFTRIERAVDRLGLQVDSLLDIGVNKLFTIYQRTQARDFIDLYFICKEKKLTIEELVKGAHLKFDWHIDLLQLGTQFTKAKEAPDYPRMITAIKDSEWQNFFVAEAIKLKGKILK